MKKKLSRTELLLERIALEVEDLRLLKVLEGVEVGRSYDTAIRETVHNRTRLSEIMSQLDKDE